MASIFVREQDLQTLAPGRYLVKSRKTYLRVWVSAAGANPKSAELEDTLELETPPLPL